MVDPQCRMLKKARLLTRPSLARRDAPCPKQGRSERRRRRRYNRTLCGPFALRMDLGEQKSLSSDSEIQEALFGTLSL